MSNASEICHFIYHSCMTEPDKELIELDDLVYWAEMLFKERTPTNENEAKYLCQLESIFENDTPCDEDNSGFLDCLKESYKTFKPEFN